MKAGWDARKERARNLFRRAGGENVAPEIDVLPKFDKFRQQRCVQAALDNISAAPIANALRNFSPGDETFAKVTSSIRVQPGRAERVNQRLENKNPAVAAAGR